MPHPHPHIGVEIRIKSQEFVEPSNLRFQRVNRGQRSACFKREGYAIPKHLTAGVARPDVKLQFLSTAIVISIVSKCRLRIEDVRASPSLAVQFRTQLLECSDSVGLSLCVEFHGERRKVEIAHIRKVLSQTIANIPRNHPQGDRATRHFTETRKLKHVLVSLHDPASA